MAKACHSAVIGGQWLVDGDRDQAIGVACGTGCAAGPAAGFEFEFSRIGERYDYQAGISEAYSMRNVRLDVRPIEMATPMYRQGCNALRSWDDAEIMVWGGMLTRRENVGQKNAHPDIGCAK